MPNYTIEARERSSVNFGKVLGITTIRGATERIWPVLSQMQTKKDEGKINLERIDLVGEEAGDEALDEKISSSESNPNKLRKMEIKQLTRYKIVLASGSDTTVENGTSLEFRRIVAAKEKNPAVRIVLLEDAPTSIQQLLELLIKNDVLPSLILVAGKNEQQDYLQLLKSLGVTEKKMPLVIPIGRFDISVDELMKESIEQAERKKTLTKLGIEQDRTIIGFIAGRGSAIQESPFATDSEYPDHNSTQLETTYRAIIEAARRSPYRKFTFIYRPHLGDRGEKYIKLFDHPLIQKINQEVGVPENLQVVTYDQQGWKEKELTSAQIAKASHFFVSVQSTDAINQNMANSLLAHELEQGEIGSAHVSVPVFLLSKEMEQFLYTIGNLPPSAAESIYLPNALRVANTEQLTDTILAFCDPETKQKYLEVLRETTDANVEYRTKGITPLERIHYWMRLIARRPSAVHAFLNKLRANSMETNTQIASA